MILYRPILRNLITQRFGLANTIPSLLSKYQSFGLLGHNGWDLVAYDGDEVYFNGDGKGRVIETSIDSAGGLGVVVIFQADNRWYKTYYWHLKEFKCHTGDILESGNLIGLADNTGFSTGSHLHFGLKECDERGETLNYGNGYLGAIDPTPYFQNDFILDIIAKQKELISLAQRVIEIINKIIGIFKKV